ncbi:MAG: prolyl oligopeptidase family serine peptidase, partial [Acidobacteria bacterium]|nr:prolyl oligopeptidase family serine peptidase [Acidobacteriota bacterium]
TLAQTKPGMTASDTLRVIGVNEAQISPTGEWVVYTVSSTQNEMTRPTLWIARAAPDLARPAENRPPQPLLPAGWTALNPRWSADGRRIAFFSTRDGQQGIWLITVTGDRQPRLVAQLRNTNFFITYEGEAFAWSPDSRRIAYINALEEEGADSEDANKKDDPRVIDRIQYKSRTSFSDRLRTHVWVTDVDNPLPRQLTSGDAYDHALTWNPNGREVAFLSNHEAEPDANHNSDIFAVDMNGQVRQITTTRGCEYAPQWSPDGRWIAYTATRRDVTTIDSVAEDTHVWVIDSRGGVGRELTASQDRRARSPRWSWDSRLIYFLAGDRGSTILYSVEARSGKVGPVFNRFVDVPEPDRQTRTTVSPSYPPRQATGFSINARAPQAMALTMGDALYPAEVWLAVPSAPLPLWRLTRHNEALLNSLSLVQPEEINFKSYDGTPVQGWLMRPLNWREGERYPLILSIHGGPHGMYGWGFNATFQAYAARGYAVLYLNPRGSSGYGQKFSDGTLREWGGGDYRDLMLGTDEVLRKHTWIDADRIGVTG